MGARSCGLATVSTPYLLDISLDESWGSAVFLVSTDVYRKIVATTTVWSGLSYVYSKDAVRILNQDEKK